MIRGKIDGIKKSILNELEEIYDFGINDAIVTVELVERMNSITRVLNKEISVAVDRKGRVIAVAVGDSRTVELPHIEKKERKLSGIRIIHTHPTGNSRLSSLDISALVEMKLDAMVAIGVSEEIEDIRINVAFCQVFGNRMTHEEIFNKSIKSIMKIDLIHKVREINKSMDEIKLNDSDIEKAILVGINDVESLDELEGLAKACGIVAVEKVVQKRNKIDSAYYTGKGKVQELSYLRQVTGAQTIIFDDELSSSQIRNLSKAIGCRIIDRTILILDIFGRRARTKQSKLQVELARLKHKLSRLRGFGANLDKMTGGVGRAGGLASRGTGETKLELDRRYIEDRIFDIKSELSRVEKLRAVQKTRRNKGNIGNVALVGYTNAGKSTLRNKVCSIAAANTSEKNGVMEANMLFATLDTTVRAVTLEDNRKIALSDTVGFIKKLPHELVESFKSTLEEVIDADLLIHVVDASNLEANEQIKAVKEVLEELGADKKNTIMVLNKVDMASEDNIKRLREELAGENVVEVSAFEGTNIDRLLERIGEEIPLKYFEKEFIFPYDSGKLVSMIHDSCNVIEEDYKDNGTYIKAQVYEEVYNKCKSFEV